MHRSTSQHMPPLVSYQDVRVYEAMLSPGDVLLLPAHWFHHVESIDIRFHSPISNFASSMTLNSICGVTHSGMMV
jgi:ribosomal protein L16 Arg81 hydroxylase